MSDLNNSVATATTTSTVAYPFYTILTSTLPSIKVFDPILEDAIIVQPLNDSDSLLIEDIPDHRKATIVIEGIILPIFGLIGIIGNIASIIHFGTNQRRRHNFQAYMFYLGIVDLFLISLSLILHSARELSLVHLLFYDENYQKVKLDGWSKDNKNIADCGSELTKVSDAEIYLQYHSVLNQMKVYLIPIYSILISMNICIHLVISVERYMVINRPFLRIKCKKYQPRTVFVAILVFATSYNATKFFEHQIVFTNLTLPNDHIKSCSFYDKWFSDKTLHLAEICPTDLRRNQIYIHLMSLSAFLFMGLIPYVTIFIINILILRRLIKHKEWTAESNQDIELKEIAPAKSDEPESGLMVVQSQARRISPYLEDKPQIHFHSDRSRRNDVLLAKLSLVIMVPYLLYHTVRIISNAYELTMVSCKIY